jgi:hypothetical protein
MYKTLVHKTNPGIYGVLKNQQIDISMIPDLMQASFSWDDLVKYIAPEQMDTLKNYELKDVQLTFL